MSVPTTLPDVKITSNEITTWLRKHKLKKTAINITKATNALRAEKQKDSIPLGRDISGVSSDDARQIIYGECVVGATETFLDTRATNRYLDGIFTIAGHEIDSVQGVYLDDCRVVFSTGSDGYSKEFVKPDGTIIPALNKFFMAVSLGADDQPVNANLNYNTPTKWTANHRQRSCAHAYCMWEWDGTLFGDGLPEVSFLVRGKKVWDPRTDTTAWSSNAALCIANFLMDTRLGVKIPLTRINVDPTITGNLVDAANVCDQDEALLTGGTEKKYTVNGYFDAEESYGRVLERMAAAMGGHITYENGKWHIWPAVWRTPVVTLTEDDIRGSIRVQTMASREDIFNTVRGTFVSAAERYVETDYPVVKNSTYIANDGEEISENIDFSFVTSPSTAQRLAKLELERIRQGIQVEFEASLKAFTAKTPENIYLTIARYGWVAKEFEIVNADFMLNENDNSSELTVPLSLRETASAVFDWNTGHETAYDVAPNTALPSPYSVPSITGVTLESGTNQLYIRGDGTVAPRVLVSWTACDDFFVNSGGKIELQYKLSTSANWIDATDIPGLSNFSYITDVRDGYNYDIQLRAVNAIGCVGAWTTIYGHTVIGKTAPPTDVTGLTASLRDNALVLQWGAVADYDMDRYEIRLGASWASSTFVNQTKNVVYELINLSAGSQTYLVKAIDSSGNYSTNAASVVVVPVAPQTPSVSYSFSGENVVLTWSVGKGSFSIATYTIRYGTSYATSTLYSITQATTLPVGVNWTGDRRFWVEATDIFGNVGAYSFVDVQVVVPGAVTNLQTSVVDNNVLLRWSAPTTGSLPIKHYNVLKGATFGAAISIGTFLGTFSTVFETVNGNFTYWVVAFDTAENDGVEKGITAEVQEPPNLVVYLNTQLANGACVNCVEVGGSIIGPVNTAETWEQHFVNNGWSSPQDQIDDGYTLYCQPEPGYCAWEKVHDVGTTLDQTTVRCSLTTQDLVAGQTMHKYLGYSADGADWTEEQDVDSIVATNFRYIRVRLVIGTAPTFSRRSVPGHIRMLPAVPDGVIDAADRRISANVGWHN